MADPTKGEIAIGLALLAVTSTAMYFGGRAYDLVRPGLADHAHFVAGTDLVLIVDHADSRRSDARRVRVHDARTGAELAHAALDVGSKSDRGRMRHRYDCIPTSTTRAWCLDEHGDDGLRLRRLDTLDVVADEARLRGLSPGMAQGLAPHAPPAIDPADGALLYLAADGELFRVTANLAATKAVDPRMMAAPGVVLDPLLGFDTGHAATTSRVRLGDRRVRLEQRGGGTRWTLTLPAAADGVPAYMGGAPPVTPHPEQTYLDAGFLLDPDRNEPVVLANPPSAVLVFHELDADGRRVVLSRVDAAGERTWTQRLAGDDVVAARLVGNVVVVALTNALVGLDAATGAIRYTHAF